MKPLNNGKIQMNVNILFFSVGYCTHPEKVVLCDGRMQIKEYPALCALIQHPKQGNCLFDTGYSSYFFTETDKYPYKLYRIITPVHFQVKDSATYQLNNLGISPDDIKYVFLSHFHADHIAGTRDFSKSKFICSKQGHDIIKDKKGLPALKYGFIPALLPTDFEDRMNPVENYPKVQLSDESLPFTDGFDLFGDSSVIAVSLEGHAPGQYGLIVSAIEEKYFLVSDAAWTERAYKENVRPNKFANLIIFKPNQYIQTLKSLHLLNKINPGITIVPSHCKDTINRIIDCKSA